MQAYQNAEKVKTLPVGKTTLQKPKSQNKLAARFAEEITLMAEI